MSVVSENNWYEANAVVLWQGRTGMGQPVTVRRSSGWVDVIYETPDGERNGFALNPYYAMQMGRELLEAGIRADEASRGPTEEGGDE